MSDVAQRRLLLAPFVIAAVALVAVPAVVTFVMAVTDYDGIGPARWTGFNNFRDLEHDAFVRDALKASAIFVALAVPLRLFVATSMALLLHRRFRGAGTGRTVTYLPTVMPEAAYALVWAFLLNPLTGPVNALLGSLGIAGPDWFASSSGAMAMYVIMAAFTIGEGFVVALAARQELPGELHDLAAIEGASPWHVLRRVTLPLMAPTLGLLACRDIALALQSTFAGVYLITDGGPDRDTLFLPVLIYDYAFEQLRYGYAAAVSLVLFAVTALLVLLLHRLMRRYRFGLVA